MSFYEDVIAGLNEAIEYKKGNVKLRTADVTVISLPKIKSNEVRAIRKSLDMSQLIFASVMGVSVKTVEAWETGKSTPSGAARRMLSLLKADPELPQKYGIVSRQDFI